MFRYTLKRIWGAVLVILAVSIITFFVLTLIPGNSAMLSLGTDATAEQLAQLEHAMGLDQPWYVRYLSWMGGLFRLDFGSSALYGQSVLTLIAQRMPVTLSLAILSMFMSLVVAILLGTLSAVYKDSPLDLLCRTLMQVGTALPGFWIGIIFIIYLALRTGMFPVSGFSPISDGFGKYFRSIFLPSLALAVGEIGPLLRSVRTSMLQALSEDYIDMGKAQGLPARTIYLKYALRGALAAPLNVAGMQFAKLLGGTTVIESVFSLPGLGRLILVAVEQRDTALLQGCVMYVSLVVVLISLGVDLLTAWLNPQVRSTQSA
jgi:peptide/nickel transport system permease protein